MSKYIITEHAKKRRDHHIAEDTDILLRFLHSLDEKFELTKKENNRYKIAYRGICAIVKKSNTSLILITQRGFKEYEYDLSLLPKLKCSIALDKNKKCIDSSTSEDI